MPAVLRPKRVSRKPTPPRPAPPRPRRSKRQPPPFDRDQYEIDCEDWIQQARRASKLADERIRKRDEREQRMQQRAAQRPKKKQKDREQENQKRENEKVVMAATTTNTAAPATRVMGEAQAADQDPASPQAQEQPDDPEAEARRCQVRRLWGHERGERSSERESRREPAPRPSREASVEFVASRPLGYTTNPMATTSPASRSTILAPHLVDTAIPILSSSLCEIQALSLTVTSDLALQTPNPHQFQDSRLWSYSIPPPPPPPPQQPLYPQVQNPAFAAPPHSNPPPPRTLPPRQGFIPPLKGYMQTFEIGDNGMFYACAGPLQRPQPSVQRRLDIPVPSDAVRHRRLPGLQVKRSAWPRAIPDPPPDRLILFGKSTPVSKSSMPSVQARGLAHHFTTSSQ